MANNGGTLISGSVSTAPSEPIISMLAIAIIIAAILIIGYLWWKFKT